jgi:IclR family KDG regulon transcriptional repressor
MVVCAQEEHLTTLERLSQRCDDRGYYAVEKTPQVSRSRCGQDPTDPRSSGRIWKAGNPPGTYRAHWFTQELDTFHPGHVGDAAIYRTWCRLGPKAVQIGAAAKRTTNLSQLFHQTARKIVEEIGETVQLTILDQAEVIYVAREDGTQPVQLASNIGGRLPAYATASGKVLLAALPDESLDALYARRPLPTLTARTISSLNQLKPELSLVRERGYAHDNQETSEGLECLAAPIYDRTGQVVAAISISFLSVRASPEHLQSILGLVQRAAQAISEQMGGRVPAAKNKSSSPEPIQ